MNRAIDRGEGTPSSELLQDFVNTREAQAGTDQFVDPTALSAWLELKGMVPTRTPMGARHLQQAIDLREGLRAVFMIHAGHDTDPIAIEQLNKVFAQLPVGLRITGERYVLAPSGRDPLAGPLAYVADAIRQCNEDGSWSRLKVCARDTCRWAFYDSSRNKVRRWCSMAGCGNHVKMKRAYARRVEST